MSEPDVLDAARWRWLVKTLESAKAGGGLELNSALQLYEIPEAGAEARVYWYAETPVGFYESTATTITEAVDAAMAWEEVE